MLRPFLLVGVGGSGGKTLRAVRKSLQLKLEQEKWSGGWPDAWQFLHIDSPISQDGVSFPAPLLPLDEYLSLVPSGVGYETIYDSLRNRVDASVVSDLEKALPSQEEVNVPIHMGAGAFRAIGRTISAASLGVIQGKLKAVLAKMTTASANGQLAQLTAHMGIPVAGAMEPTAIIVSSIAGGSGAGQYQDVAEAIKSAAGNVPWTEDMFALLYAPDVFANLGRREIPANALGAIAETMSGFWSKNLSRSSTALYTGQGLIPSSSPRYRTGAAFPYIIGSNNGLVNFGDQSDVYLAVASSIAAWMVDHQIQDKVSAYTVTNYAAKAPTLPDKSGLRKTGKTNPEAAPFSSMGFGRVSLGLERFYEYSSERLARAALSEILDKHTQQDALLAQKTAQQWLMDNSELAFGAFLRDAGLDQQVQADNQLLADLRPDTQAFQARMKAAVEAAARGGMPDGGHSYSNWVSRIENGYQVNIPSVLADHRNELLAKVRGWVETMPEKILSLVAQTASRQGLPVTVELLSRTLRHSRQSLEELERERKQLLAEAENLKTLITQSMQAASNMAKVPPGNPAVAQGVRQTQLALVRRTEADIREVAAEVLSDFADNFLEPLRQSLAGSANVLRLSRDDPKLPDGRQNPYGSWPSAGNASVPKRFKPAPNERLLIDYKNYGAEYERLIKETISDSKVDASRVVLDQFIMGSYGIEELENLRDEQKWKFIELDRIWVPKERQYQAREGANQSAQFSFLSDHMEYVDRAKKWLTLPGRSFSAYLDQTLAAWLADDSDKARQSQRHAIFVKEFDAAVASSAPLVQRNSKLLVTIHPPQEGLDASENDVLFSAIPVATSDDLFEPLKNVLIKYLGAWTPELEGFFVGETGAPKVKQVDVFSVTSVPVQPMALGSVMQPIAQEWLSSSVNKDSRGNFMQWRRARPLSESIPASPDIWRQMIAGWYVAKLFQHIPDPDTKDPAFAERGPHLKIWGNGGSHGQLSFPYPLYYPEIAPTPDLVGIVMESMIIALVNCFSAGSLAPLAAYQRLTELGDLSATNSQLTHWIKAGHTLEADAPQPPEDRAGSVSVSIDERKELCINYFRGQLESFEKYIDRQDKYGDIRTYPVSWEIRQDIADALKKIISEIGKIEDYDSGLGL